MKTLLKQHPYFQANQSLHEILRSILYQSRKLRPVLRPDPHEYLGHLGMSTKYSIPISFHATVHNVCHRFACIQGKRIAKLESRNPLLFVTQQASFNKNNLYCQQKICKRHLTARPKVWGYSWLPFMRLLPLQYPESLTSANLSVASNSNLRNLCQNNSDHPTLQGQHT